MTGYTWRHYVHNAIFMMSSHITGIGLCKTKRRCENGGTCLGNNASSVYKCNCPSGFSGDDCNISKFESQELYPSLAHICI